MEMDAMWDKIKKGLKDGAALSMEKIEEYTKIGKLKVEELAAKRKIERSFIDMGERVYELITTGKSDDVNGDLAVKKSVDNVKKLRQDIEDIAAKIKAVQQEYKQDKKSADDDEITGI